MPTRSRSLLTMTAFAVMVAATTLLVAQAPSSISPDQYRSLRYRYIGPMGNRVIAVAGLPGDPAIYYAGTASGGIFKTTDGGVHWEPIFDGQPVSSVGALAIAPTDANVIWAGTGESFIRSHISVGEGIYKSTDAGKTWTRRCTRGAARAAVRAAGSTSGPTAARRGSA